MVGVEDVAGTLAATDVEAALAEIITLLASVANTEGAAMVGVEDVAGTFAATDVEAALAEIITLLASVANTEGAAMVGVEDVAGTFAATDVEAALAEIITLLASVANTEGAAMIGVEDVAGTFAAVDVEAALAEIITLLASVANTEGAAMVGVEDVGGLLVATDVEAALAEAMVAIDVLADKSICINLHSFREVDANGDVGNLAAHGGILASDSTPILLGGTSEAEEISWVANDVDAIAMSFSLPADFDGTADVTVRAWISTGAGGPDPANMTVNTSWDKAAQVVDTIADGAPSAAIKELVAVIANADIPASPNFLTLQIVPPAHANDPIDLHGIRLEYSSTAS